MYRNFFKFHQRSTYKDATISGSKFCPCHGQLQNPQASRHTGNDRGKVSHIVYHHDCAVTILLLHSGMRCEFLPPYSPDFNPIELAFSAMKYNLRRNGDYTRLAMTQLEEKEIYLTLVRALCTSTPDDVYGWYSHCGYV